MAKAINNISDEAVRNATGKGWDEWIALLDEEGAEDKSHKEIAAMLIEKKYIESGWWAQSVTVGYEYAKGRRVKGETKDAGFQIGVQRTLPVEARRVWQLLTSPEGLRMWLGSGVDGLTFEKGATYNTEEGTSGEIRSVYPGEKLRLTWQPANWENESTLQLYLLDRGEKTALRFHQEKLAGPEQRAEMKKHWKDVLKQLKAVL